MTNNLTIYYFILFIIGISSISLTKTNPFSDLIEEGDIENFRKLLTSIVHNSSDLTNKIHNNGSLLISATEKNYFAIVEMLLQQDANPNYREPLFNETALFKASFKGFYEIANLLIKYGANVSLTIKNEETCLMWSSFKGHINIVDLLISNGANINAQDTKYGYSPLMVAAQNNHIQVVRTLLSHGCLVHLKNIKGLSALDLAMARNNVDIVKLLSNYSDQEL